MNPAELFESIVSEHYKSLFIFAMSLTGAESDAADLTQQTFYIWAAKGHQLRDVSKVKGWLFTTLHRTFLAARRSRNRFIQQNLEEVVDELPAASLPRFDLADSSQALSALASLDEIYRAPVTLFYLEDCSYKDIAAILELPLGTVKSRISRGILQLRKRLLPGDTRDSSLNRDAISCIVGADETGASPEQLLAQPRGVAELAVRDADGGYEEWDFSSTYLREVIGMM